MKIPVVLISTFVVLSSAFTSAESYTFDIKDNGEYCQASIAGNQTRVDIFAERQQRKDSAVIIQEQVVLHQSSVDGLCMLTGSKSIYLVLMKTGTVVEISNPIAVAENTAGTHVAIQYVDKGKRAVYFMDSDGKETHVPFSNYSLSGLGYGYHNMKFTPDDANLMIIEGLDFAEKMLLISTSEAKVISLKDIPAELANNHGALSYIDDRISVLVEDGNTFVVTDFSHKKRIKVPADHVFAGSFDHYLVFLNSKSMVLYDLKTHNFGSEIGIPAELSGYIQSNAVEYLELKPMKGKRLWLKTTNIESYQFNLTDKRFKKTLRNAPCSLTGDYCL
jgi:hypothetical protein